VIVQPLAHELGHIYNNDGGSVDMNMEKIATGSRPTKEALADEFASTHLVPQDQLDRFIAETQPYFSTARILSFSASVAVHPGLVVEQLQHRGLVNWSSFRSMLVPVRAQVVSASLTDGWGSSVVL
jgi:HTH-type transcriptional regulator/antitoxin HigA